MLECSSSVDACCRCVKMCGMWGESDHCRCGRRAVHFVSSTMRVVVAVCLHSENQRHHGPVTKQRNLPINVETKMRKTGKTEKTVQPLHFEMSPVGLASGTVNRSTRLTLSLGSASENLENRFSFLGELKN